MSKKWKLWLLALVVSICVMALIVRFSAQPGADSNDFSKGIAGRILALFQNAIPDLTMDGLNFFLRKLAHFTLYFVLGCSLTGVFMKQHKVPAVLAALLTGTVFAASDELHQMFSDGRSASVKDVLLDTCGVAVGSILAWIAVWRIRKKSH